MMFELIGSVIMGLVIVLCVCLVFYIWVGSGMSFLVSGARDTQSTVGLGVRKSIQLNKYEIIHFVVSYGFSSAYLLAVGFDFLTVFNTRVF